MDRHFKLKRWVPSCARCVGINAYLGFALFVTIIYILFTFQKIIRGILSLGKEHRIGVLIPSTL